MLLPRWMVAVGLGLACTAMAGCELFNGDDDDDELTTTRSGGRYDDRYDGRYDSRGDVVIGRDRTSDADRYDDGRQARWPDSTGTIPAGATTVGEMDGGNMTFRPRQDGKVYVFDSTDERVIWSGRLRDGERFVLRPAQHDATINGQSVDLPRLGAGHGFSLYFLPER